MVTVSVFFKQSWDNDLARLAQYWAANCEYEHNEHRHDQSEEYDYVGENVAATGKQVNMLPITLWSHELCILCIYFSM